jgi:hypothetical protein
MVYRLYELTYNEVKIIDPEIEKIISKALNVFWCVKRTLRFTNNEGRDYFFIVVTFRRQNLLCNENV